MKKWLLCGIVFFTVLIAAFLGMTAVDPADYTGDWYYANGQRIYRFQEGIIYCDQYSVALTDGSSISGAYVFSGDSITLFAMGIEGLETVKELYLVENEEEFLLCEKEDGTGQIYFVRHK